MNSTSSKFHKKPGFTIVELLVVIVVITILATISIVAYNGIQARARDSQRINDVKAIAQALEMYYIDEGRYPSSGCGSSCPTPKKINSSWATTSDGSWSVLEQALVPKYISELPTDPEASLDTQSAVYGGYNYDYVITSSWCGAASGQLYLLSYRLEGRPQKRDIIGECSTSTPTNYYSSEYAVRK